MQRVMYISITLRCDLQLWPGLREEFVHRLKAFSGTAHRLKQRLTRPSTSASGQVAVDWTPARHFKLRYLASRWGCVHARPQPVADGADHTVTITLLVLDKYESVQNYK